MTNRRQFFALFAAVPLTQQKPKPAPAPPRVVYPDAYAFLQNEVAQQDFKITQMQDDLDDMADKIEDFENRIHRLERRR